MTFDDDYIRLSLSAGAFNVPCKRLGLSWPPPEFIVIEDVPLKRLRHSAITDEQRAGMTHVCRGAEYVRCELHEIQQHEGALQ